MNEVKTIVVYVLWIAYMCLFSLGVIASGIDKAISRSDIWILFIACAAVCFATFASIGTARLFGILKKEDLRCTSYRKYKVS